MTKGKIIKAANTERRKVVFSKGIRREVVELEDIKITLRGLAYHEALGMTSLKPLEAIELAFRIGVVAIEGKLQVLDDETNKIEKHEATFVEEDIEGTMTRMVSLETFEIFKLSPLIMAELVGIINELSSLNEADGKAVRIFRKGKPTGMQENVQVSKRKG